MPGIRSHLPQMASHPKNRSITVAFEGGTLTGARGLLEYILELDDLGWRSRTVVGGPRRKRFGSKQRSNAKAGKVHFLKLDDDKLYTVRVTGSTKNFIDRIITRTKSGKVLDVMTQSGSKESRDLPVLS